MNESFSLPLCPMANKCQRRKPYEHSKERTSDEVDLGAKLDGQIPMTEEVDQIDALDDAHISNALQCTRVTKPRHDQHWTR